VDVWCVGCAWRGVCVVCVGCVVCVCVVCGVCGVCGVVCVWGVWGVWGVTQGEVTVDGVAVVGVTSPTPPGPMREASAQDIRGEGITGQSVALEHKRNGSNVQSVSALSPPVVELNKYRIVGDVCKAAHATPADGGSGLGATGAG